MCFGTCHREVASSLWDEWGRERLGPRSVPSLHHFLFWSVGDAGSMYSLPRVSFASSSSTPRCELCSYETRSTEKVDCLLLSGDRLHFEWFSLWLGIVGGRAVFARQVSFVLSWWGPLGGHRCGCCWLRWSLALMVVAKMNALHVRSSVTRGNECSARPRGVDCWRFWLRSCWCLPRG